MKLMNSTGCLTLKVSSNQKKKDHIQSINTLGGKDKCK